MLVVNPQELIAQFCDIMHQYLGKSETPITIAIGVSGGSDSIALMYCCHVWQQRYAPHVFLLPLIVDHGARASSADEAQQVLKWLTQWGLAPKLITCTGLRASQANFRRARYQQLILACRHHGATHLLLGHHQDDVLETVWMRQQCGSDWRGLAGMTSQRVQWGVQVFRPLLRFRKHALRSVIQAEGLDWIEDPSNHCERFYRTHARKFFVQATQAERHQIWNQTCLLAQRRYEESLELRQKTPLKDCAGGYTIPLDAPCFDIPLEQGAWLLSQWLASVHLLREPLKKKVLARTWHILSTTPRTTEPHVAFTLGGCIGLIYRRQLYWMREWRRISNMMCPSYQNSWCWDGRFLFSGEIQQIRPCGLSTTQIYLDLIPKDLPAYIARWAIAAMPQCAKGTLYYPQDPCPIFYPITR